MLFLEFPQNLIGYIAFLVHTNIKKRPYYKYKDAYVVHIAGLWGAISFSRYIFADDNYYNSDIIKHEYGHRKQSQLLLFLYIFIVGLPSLIWAGFFKGYRIKYRKSYYWFYTEAWANKLAGIDLK
ncbi:MAG: hypothetical protein AB9835_01870 [Eubacteriales bacterium]